MILAHLGRRSIPKGGMRAQVVVELPPALDDSPGFSQIPEPLAVQAFVAQLPVEALHEAVVPRLAGRNEAGPTFMSRSHFMTRVAMNSAPWPERMKAGFP